MPELRDGTVVEDQRLDRLQQFDERSRSYGVAEVVEPTRFKAKLWALDERNDQGPDGACVGFGTGHRLAAAPVQVSGVDYGFSFGLYKEAQRLDPWEGEDYEGTSVLAGIKAAQARGLVGEYRWCFTIEDYIQALLTEGPVLVGTNWYTGMFTPDEDGFIFPTGEVAGGHCYILRGVKKVKGRVVFRITNSWGKDWGKNGEAFIYADDFVKLMEGGEGAVLYEVKKQHHKAAAEAPEAQREGKRPWQPGGASLFNRTQGLPWSGRHAAGIFKRGPFRLGT